MATVTYRATKGSPLTSNELDANFLALNENKIETSAIGSDILEYYAHLDAFAQAFTLPSSDGSSGNVLVTDGNGSLTFSGFDALPTQTNNSGKYLTTDGSSAYWTDAISGSGDSGGLVNLGIDTQAYTVTSAQSTFGVNYSDSQVLVYVNGIKLDSGEYTATSGTSITLSEALQAGDIIDIVGYTTTVAPGALPDQTGNAGYYLTTDGTDASWVALNTATSHYLKSEVDSIFAGSTPKTGYNASNWDAAYGWGDHRAEGYLTDVPSQLQTNFALINSIAGISAYSAASSSTATFDVFSFAAAEYRSAKLLIQATNTVDSTYYVSELLCFHDGTDAYSTEYATMHTSAEPQIEVVPVINNGNFIVRITPSVSDALEYKFSLSLVTV